ncbi:MAG: hypothetical protein QJT81_10500 [Candidatus Thiothrix putei]|uniref:Uncharacterized protein n=1 Tax=Candidatus Thiothrix putei TaxID=3080811 RepID=A0AA95KST8_9GAMM|nr:hypothetical protein [Thiothrix subterranea]QQZ30574.1 hypothetical protein HMY34_18445 [Thiothrix subterranea]WGZ96363.1 MAG: hypothetical protein QJT81_10500 [Candidatus Thiothrix putei]
MKQMMLQEKYPVFTMEVGKNEIAHRTVDGIVDYFLAKIAEHPVAQFIAVFDHYAHTKALPQGEIAADIIAAKNVVFCFGTHLPNPQVLAVRPRAIGIAEKADTFVISFMEAPMPLANNAMEAWAKALVIND